MSFPSINYVVKSMVLSARIKLPGWMGLAFPSHHSIALSINVRLLTRSIEGWYNSTPAAGRSVLLVPPTVVAVAALEILQALTVDYVLLTVVVRVWRCSS